MLQNNNYKILSILPNVNMYFKLALKLSMEFLWVGGHEPPCAMLDLPMTI